MMVLSSFEYNVPRKARHTVGGDAAIPSAENNPFVKARVLFTKPDKFSIREQGAELLHMRYSITVNKMAHLLHCCLLESLCREKDLDYPTKALHCRASVLFF